MKYCPKCLSEYANEDQKFCGSDGSALASKATGGDSFPASPVSPSEIVLLCADKFADFPGLSSSRPQHLSLMMMSAMVLSAEHAGYIHLQSEPRGKTFMHTNRLHVRVGSTTRRWPQWSMEDKLCSLLAQAGTANLDDLIYRLWERDFKRDVPGSWAYGRMLVMQGLVGRDLIRVSADWETYQVHESLAGITSPPTFQPLRQLFSETMQRRPEVWAALQWDINYGVCKRAEQNSTFAIRLPF